MSTPAQNVLAAALSELGREVERWRDDHRAVMARYEFESLLALAVKIFDAITEQDEEWRSRFYSGAVEYEPTVERRIEAAYREWLAPCDGIETELKRLEGQFGRVRHADEFRNRRREAEGLLTSDAEFFGEGLTDLCDAAVDEHRKGKTLEHR